MQETSDFRLNNILRYFDLNFEIQNEFLEDFPHGTWLGDETNPEMRVRVPITPR